LENGLKIEPTAGTKKLKGKDEGKRRPGVTGVLDELLGPRMVEVVTVPGGGKKRINIMWAQ